MNRVPVNPDLIRWARNRGGFTVGKLAGRFPKLAAWEAGEMQPTLKQLEAFARATHVPVGYLFLLEPPQERVPIPDLRTMADCEVGRPSPDLLDTIHLCQQRQAWYREYARTAGEPLRDFVGSADVNDSVADVAAMMREDLGLDLEQRRLTPTWTHALRTFIDHADQLGVLVMVSGVVGANTSRKLDPEEFRGFALCDKQAPLVFINGADTKAAQMFTLAHELAHTWLGQSALSDAGPRMMPSKAIELWCNQVAAELLVPMHELRRERCPDNALCDELESLARSFKVSTLVILRRLHDAGALGAEYWQLYEGEVERLQRMPKGTGGHFYLTQAVRAGKRFARAVILSTFEGQNSFTEACRLLGVRKVETLRRFGAELDIGV